MQNNHLSLETIKRIALVIILCFIGALQRNTISACYDYSVKRPAEQSLRLGMSNDEFNRMTITPITGAEYVSRNVVNFNGRKKGNNSKVTAPQHSSSAIKAIPVAVLIAMSPLNTTSVASDYSPMSISPRVEMVPQDPQFEPSIVFRSVAEKDGEYFRIIGITTDNNRATIETLGFNYEKDYGDSLGRLNGKVVAICDEPVKEEKSLIAYRSIVDGQQSGIKLCYLPNELRSSLYSISKSSVMNRNAVGVLPQSEFTEFFGDDVVKNAPNISDCVTSYSLKE